VLSTSCKHAYQGTSVPRKCMITKHYKWRPVLSALATNVYPALGPMPLYGSTTYVCLDCVGWLLLPSMGPVVGHFRPLSLWFPCKPRRYLRGRRATYYGTWARIPRRHTSTTSRHDLQRRRVCTCCWVSNRRIRIVKPPRYLHPHNVGTHLPARLWRFRDRKEPPRYLRRARISKRVHEIVGRFGNALAYDIGFCGRWIAATAQCARPLLTPGISRSKPAVVTAKTRPAKAPRSASLAFA
jgi:hypothetical protein